MDGGVILFLALFLLGYGWNLGFVAGSALLTRGLGLAERTRVEGLTDSLIWSSAAAASLGPESSSPRRATPRSGFLARRWSSCRPGCSSAGGEPVDAAAGS